LGKAVKINDDTYERLNDFCGEERRKKVVASKAIEKYLNERICPDCGGPLRYIGHSKDTREDYFRCLCGREFTKEELKEEVAE